MCCLPVLDRTTTCRLSKNASVMLHIKYRKTKKPQNVLTGDLAIHNKVASIVKLLQCPLKCHNAHKCGHYFQPQSPSELPRVAKEQPISKLKLTHEAMAYILPISATVATVPSIQLSRKLPPKMGWKNLSNHTTTQPWIANFVEIW